MEPGLKVRVSSRGSEFDGMAGEVTASVRTPVYDGIFWNRRIVGYVDGVRVHLEEPPPRPNPFPCAEEPAPNHPNFYPTVYPVNRSVIFDLTELEAL